MKLIKKNNIKIYQSSPNNTLKRREELLKNIINSDVNFPDSILHDDLDLGMLNFIKDNFKIISDGNLIPIVPKILTIQKWSEFENNWTFSDDDKNIELPFITIIRKPDPQPGSNPIVQRTIPNRPTFFYSSHKKWDGNNIISEIYKIPQPVAIDISFNVNIVCNRFTDLNKFNQKVLEKFSSRQSYTIVKGHYIPIILDSIDDNSPIDVIDGRRFYLQTYKFTMLGLLLDSNDFEILPSLNRYILTTEIIDENKKNISKSITNNNVDISTYIITANGVQTQFSVGEIIGTLFNVSINGLLQTRDVNYFHIGLTSKITFVSPPPEGSKIIITYFAGKTTIIKDNNGNVLNLFYQTYIYDGSTLIFETLNQIKNIISLDINGLQEHENQGYVLTDNSHFELLGAPVINSNINIIYLS